MRVCGGLGNQVQVTKRTTDSAPSSAPEPGRSVRLPITPRTVPRPTLAVQIAIGIAAALISVGVRYALPLAPIQIPTLLLLVAVAVTTTFVGTGAGVAAAVTGGLLSWRLFFMPARWDLTLETMIPLLAFAVIAAVIITTSHLYRVSEQRRHEVELADVHKQAQAAELFANEMSHRLKNALAIVQAIAFQTLGKDRADTSKFAARLKLLADAHDLLSEHVERPTARVADVVEAALRPFQDGGKRVVVECPDVRIPAQQVVSLALALHELGTNASKYGALSSVEGKVRVEVEDLGEWIGLSWIEQDGPPVTPPAGSGFGTKLLGRIGSKTELSFDPNGVRCSFYLRQA